MTTKNKTFLKKKLPAYIQLASSLSLVVGAMGVTAPAFAQSTSEQTEEVIVTGQRKSIESAQMIKRESEVVVDSVTAVDIGALPDRSVSEALQRIPGVQLQRTNENRDPARLAAEGGAVFVRGLSWVRTELNGRDIFSAANGRSLGFEDVSADLMSGVDVYKSPSANMIEGGVGGTVNLRTRLPFDASGQVIAGSVDYNHAELYDKGFPSFNSLYSNRWETGIGEIGVLASVSIAEIGNRTDSIQTGRYESYDIDPAKDVEDFRYLPTGLGFRRIDWEQERNAFAVATQWAPNDQFTLTLQALKTEANPEDVERAAGLNTPGGGNVTPDSGTYTYDDEGFLYSGVMRNVAYSLNTRYGKKETGTDDYSVNFKYEADDHWTFTGDLQYVSSEADMLSSTAFTQLGAGNGVNNHSGLTAYFDFGGVPSLSITGADRQAMQSEYWWAAAMDHIEDNEADSVAARLDADYKFDESSFIRSMAFGIRTSDRDTITRQSGWNWAFLSNQFWGGAGSADAIAHLDDYASDQSEHYDFDNFFRGNLDVPGTGWFPKESLLSDTQYAYEQLKATQTSGWGWSPLEAPAAYDLNPRSDNVSAGINEQNEKTAAGYVMVRFGDDTNEILGVPFDGNFGVRVVETDTTARGRSAAGGLGEQCGTSSSADCAGAKVFVDDFNAKFGNYANYSHSYTNVLPSLNLRLMVTDEVQVRFGASRAMVRPAFSQTQPYTNLSFDFEGDKFDPTRIGAQGSGTAGAPYLKPTTADQLDASVEYYFADTSSLTFSAFYKKLNDYVSASTVTDRYTYGGRTYDFEVTRQINAGEGKLKGFEISYQQFFDMLPEPFDGLGIQTNYTYIDNSGGANTAVNIFDTAQVEGVKADALPVEGMSKTSYNLALMYEKYDVSARLAYNWRERYLLTTSAANINRPVWFNDYGQLDASLFYNLTENIKVGMQVTNLLAERTVLEVGDTKMAGDYSWTEGDRRAAFVVRAQF
jgi:TonB-dependent receptor